MMPPSTPSAVLLGRDGTEAKVKDFFLDQIQLASLSPGTLE